MSEIKMPDLSDIPGNSHQERLEEKYRIQKEEPKESRPNSRRSSRRKAGFFQSFVQNDLADVRDYVWNDLIVPGIQDWILSGLEMLFDSFGNGRGRRRSNRRDSHRDYTKDYDRGRSSYRRRNRRSNDDEFDYQNVVLDSRAAAEDLLFDLNKSVRNQNDLSIADFCECLRRLSNRDFVNLSRNDIPSRFTDNNWGWSEEDVRNEFRTKRVSDGYLIVVPEAYYLGD